MSVEVSSLMASDSSLALQLVKTETGMEATDAPSLLPYFLTTLGNMTRDVAPLCDLPLLLSIAHGSVITSGSKARNIWCPYLRRVERVGFRCGHVPGDSDAQACHCS